MSAVANSYQYSSNGNYVFRFPKRRRTYIDESESLDTRPELPESSRIISNSNLNSGYETKGVSPATMRKIKKHIIALSESAEIRKIRNSKGEIANHLLMFVTLTLPATQAHDDIFITKRIFGAFLDKCRKNGMLHNYFWRAEKQKNGNIHYHLLTDTYCSQSHIRRHWYAVLRKFDYMQRYTTKFSSMTLSDYSTQPYNRDLPFHQVSARYVKGNRCKWSEPPCVNVSYANTTGAVSRYLSKYVGKSESGSENIVKGRVWGASDSVREACKILTSDQELLSFWFNYSQQVLRSELLEFEYFDLSLCKLSKIKAWNNDFRNELLRRLRTVFVPCIYYINYGVLF